MATFSASWNQKVLSYCSHAQDNSENEENQTRTAWVEPFLNSQTFTAAWINKAFWKPEEQKSSPEESSLSTHKCPATVGHWRGPVSFSVHREGTKQNDRPAPVVQTSTTISCCSFSEGQRRNSEGSSWVGMRSGVRNRRCGSRSQKEQKSITSSRNYFHLWQVY